MKHEFEIKNNNLALVNYSLKSEIVCVINTETEELIKKFDNHKDFLNNYNAAKEWIKNGSVIKESNL